jgi:hypothetical protein
MTPNLRSYFKQKLFEINYRMAIHPGNANRRLASEAVKIRILPYDEVPEQFKKGFMKLRQLVEYTLNTLSAPGLTPIRLRGIRSRRGIQNQTAAKYIKLLFDIEVSLEEE